MIFPCPNKIVCPPQGNLDYDFPLANLSSENPDHEIFVGFAWGPLDSGGGEPPIGTVWSALGCAFVCESIISQEDADLCAQQQAALCTWNGWRPPNPPHGPGSFGGTPHGPPVIYTNNLAQCSEPCPDGSLFTWTILPGTFHALTQALADQIATSFACQKAAVFFFCIGNLTSTAQVGMNYTSTAFVTGNNPGPFNFQIVAGSLPPGLQTDFAVNSINIFGTPTQAGTFNFTVQATDASGNFMQKNFTITVTSTCAGFWQSLVGSWAFNTVGNSTATATAMLVSLFADAPKPGPSQGTAEAFIATSGPLSQQFNCQLTVTPIQLTNLPPAVNVQFSLLVQDAITPAVYFNQTFNGNNLPGVTTFQFTLPAGAHPQIDFLCTLINALNGQDSVLAYNIQLG